MLILMLDLSGGLKKFQISKDYRGIVPVIIQSSADNVSIAAHVKPTRQCALHSYFSSEPSQEALLPTAVAETVQNFKKLHAPLPLLLWESGGFAYKSCHQGERSRVLQV